MNYETIFPRVLEKTYKNFRDVSEENFPKSMVKSVLFGRRIICLPFLDVTNLQLGDLNLLEEKEDFEIKVSERNDNFSLIRKSLIEAGFKENVVKGHIVLELTSGEDLWRRFHKHTRNDIRKAQKSRISLKKIDSLGELKKFYSLYLVEMKKFGTPQHSFLFFKNCFELMGESFFGVNCYLNEKIIASTILFIGEKNSYLAFNVSNEKHRDCRPNDLLYWENILWAMKKGAKYFDMGQVDLNYKKNSREEKLLRFKQKWLGRVYRKIYFTKGFSYELSKRDKLKKFRKAWARLPKTFVKILGPIICAQIA